MIVGPASSRPRPPGAASAPNSLIVRWTRTPSSRERPLPCQASGQAIVYAPRAGDVVAGEGRAIVSAPTAAELVAHARPRRLRPTPLPPPQVRAVRSALLGAAAAAIAVVAGVATMAVGGDQPVHF